MYRLLEVGEIQQIGDEIYNEFEERWEKISKSELGTTEKDRTVTNNDYLIRRKIQVSSTRTCEGCYYYGENRKLSKICTTCIRNEACIYDNYSPKI